jgi:thymidylate kinase
LAVHAAAETERLHSLIDMLRPIAAQVCIPHLTLVLEASFGTCQSRIAKKSGTARSLDELTANSRFHTREAEFYRWLGSQSSGVIFLDADPDGAEQLAEKALALIESRIPGV